MEYEGQKFEVEGFPEPRGFQAVQRTYTSGRERGSDWDMKNL